MMTNETTSRYLKYGQRAAGLALHHPKGWRSVLYNTAMAKLRKPGPLMMPVHVTIEPTNLCNLRCPVCETGNGTMERHRGTMDLEAYKSLIDQIAPTTSVLMFYFMGEPFLHPQAYEMIRYARQKGLFVETCSNGDILDPVATIESDVNQISVQIDGMDSSTHGTYRVRSDFDKVSGNLVRLVEEKRKHPGSNVNVEVGFIVMKHNEHQVDRFLDWARQIGVDRANIIDPCVRSVAEGRVMLPTDRKYWFYDEAAFERGQLRPKVIPYNECTWIWNSTTINWDGSVVPCCRDPHGRNVLGNVLEEPLRAIWNGERARAFRAQIANNQASVGICRLCSGYGVPDISARPTEFFEVKRHSVNPGMASGT